MVAIAAGPLLPALLALLGTLLPGPGAAQTSVKPLEAIISRGGSMKVNCTAFCDQRPTLGLETPLTKSVVASGSHWVTYELSDIQDSSTPMCFSNCGTKQSAAPMSITVYWFPERVDLAPLPHWQPVGKNLTLRCQVKGGAPRAHLSVVMLRGEEVLNQQPVVKDPAEVTATVLARRDDHGTNFSCRTELDLRPLGLGLFQNSSVSRQLRTFVLPKTRPHLAIPRIMEVGTQWPLNCTLDGLFPASEARVHLALEDQKLKPTVKYSKDFLWATAWVNVTAKDKGIQQLTCAVMLANEDQRTQENVTIYSFPAPSLTLRVHYSPLEDLGNKFEVFESTMVIVECKAHAGAVVMLSGAPTKPPASSAQLKLNASAEDNGRLFSCSAALEVAGQVLYKNKTQELHVLYGPRLDERDCLGNWTWQEGSQQTLRCEAQGNPTPKLECHRKKDGALLPIGDLRPVKWTISGTYTCEATSRLGVVTREVVVNVISQPNNMVIILVAAAVILGTVCIAAYLYNRQRKIREYKLQKAQEAAAMKLNTPP